MLYQRRERKTRKGRFPTVGFPFQAELTIGLAFGGELIIPVKKKNHFMKK